MNLSDLQEQERVALVALVVQLMRLDGVSSDDELEELRALGVEMGPRAFDHAYTRAREDVASQSAALSYAGEVVQRPAARELVYTVLADMASTDGLDDAERAFLAAVREMWSIVTITR